MENRESQSGDGRSWAPPRMGVEVERRDPWELATHGTFAGLLAGLALGVTAIIASTLPRGDPWLPFDFAAAIVVDSAECAPAAAPDLWSGVCVPGVGGEFPGRRAPALQCARMRFRRLDSRTRIGGSVVAFILGRDRPNLRH
jgi:hypothetical protein